MIQTLNNFQQRFLMSLLGIALLTLIIFFSHTPPCTYVFVGFVGLVQALSLWEYYNLASKKMLKPQKGIGLFFSLAYLFLYYLHLECGLQFGALAIVLYSFVGVSFLFHLTNHTNAVGDLATTLFGFIYITIPLSFLLPLNGATSSVWIVYLLICTKITDTAAYIAGKTLGNHRLAPTLSPKKTIEGALAGLFGASVASTLFFVLATGFGYQQFASFSWQEMAFLGLCIGVIAQIGDLAESLLKRDANVKDSNTLPGFGGMLDIVDSLLFTAPLLFVWLNTKDIIG